MKYEFDLIVIGGGSAGLLAAEVAPKLGLKTALVERSRLGGDCLWTGCVPSKALLASAKVAHTMRHADKFGLPSADVELDTSTVWKRISEVQEAIATTDDSPDRYRKLGVEVVFGDGTLVDEHTVRVGERALTARRILLCTGSRPAIPPIEGLDEVGFLTSESIFRLERAPRSLMIVGAGPVGIEIAQAMNRLGVKTTLLELVGRVLQREEPALSEILLQTLRDEGVEVHLDCREHSATRREGSKVLSARMAGEEHELHAEEVFVATGRKPNIETLGLDRVGVKTDRGIELAEVLEAPKDGVGRSNQERPEGELLRVATEEDRQRQAGLDDLHQRVLKGCQELLSQRGLPITAVDVEQLFDGRTIIVYYLGEPTEKLGPIAVELSKTADNRRVQFQPLETLQTKTEVSEQPSVQKPKRSKQELIKESSQFLRGTIMDELSCNTDKFSADDVSLLKFHGTYQQDDRDSRKGGRSGVAKSERTHSFMVRTRVPGGVLTADQLLTALDLGDRYTEGCVLSESGEVLETFRVATTMVAMARTMNGFEASRVVLEVGTHSPWVSRVVEQAGHDLIIANPRRV